MRGEGSAVKAASMMEVVALRDSRWLTPARLAYRVGSERSRRWPPCSVIEADRRYLACPAREALAPLEAAIARSRPLTN